MTLAERRAGHALAHAAIAAGRWVVPSGCLRVGVQGFGTLGRGTMLALAEAGVAVTAVADESACLLSDKGLDVLTLLRLPHGAHLVGHPSSGGIVAPRAALFEVPVDVLVLAACEDAVSVIQAESLPALSVVVGANLGLNGQVEDLLAGRGVPVVPDFVGGCGGSASMDALFGPDSCPSSQEVLAQLAARMKELVRQVLGQSVELGATPREAGLALGTTNRPAVAGRPYGRWVMAELVGTC